MTEIRVPRLNTNDLSYVLLEWLVDDGAPVRRGDPVAVVETAKAAEELDCPADGYLRRLVDVGAECSVGEVIARLTAAPAAVAPAAVAPAELSPSDDGTGTVITGPARELMRELGIDRARVEATGLRVVRRADVAALVDIGADVPPGGDVVTLSRTQRAVAATVTQSHATIPAAFVAMNVRVDAARRLTRDLTRRHRRLFGLPELVVKAVGALHGRFPLCFASPLAEGSVRLGAAHVGITLDLGHGLVVPVVRAVDALPLVQVSAELTRLRAAVGSAEIRESDLLGATIVVALNNDDDVSVAVPIVFPGQVCAVSLAGVRTELTLGPDGAPTPTAFVNLGLAYDHRVINGREAVEFLRAAKALLESPEDLLATVTAAPAITGTRG